jgi:hypothetical protein
LILNFFDLLRYDADNVLCRYTYLETCFSHAFMRKSMFKDMCRTFSYCNHLLCIKHSHEITANIFIFIHFCEKKYHFRKQFHCQSNKHFQIHIIDSLSNVRHTIKIYVCWPICTVTRSITSSSPSCMHCMFYSSKSM